jgi:Lrp/AsnC family transcriptional regulator, leucine-responsive regulatory protein
MQFKLDKKDKKIIEQLDLNARQSNAQIARKVGLSKDAVGYRIKKFEEKKLIKGYFSVLNISKLGYVSYKLMITFRNTKYEIEQRIIKDLIKNRNVGWVVNCDGIYNLMVIIWVKSTLDFDRFFRLFLEKYSKYLQERDISIVTEQHTCRKAYLYDKNRDTSRDNYTSGEPKEIVDKTDLKILKMIANNSRIAFYKIALEVGLTAEAIAHRVKKLQRENIILAFKPLFDITILGYQSYNVSFKLNNFNEIDKIFNFFKNHSNIISFQRYLGKYDLGIDINVKNTKEFRQILKEIKELFINSIESYHSMLIYKEHKLSYFLDASLLK